MNNRFKFRFWHKSKNHYINTEKLVLNDGTYTQVGTKQMNNGTYCSYIVNEYNTSEIIPEQCTGLKDKNGKLIYDGDYIRAVNQDTKDRPDLQVGHIWVDEMGCRWIKFKTEELSWNDFCSLIDYDATLEIEVLGNIHENADLIKVGGK
jgi:uncharacterized phage protein (TIGR01671 family)